MDISMSKMAAIFRIVSVWADKALSDGKVTLLEATALVTDLAEVIGIPTDIQGAQPEIEPVQEEKAPISLDKINPELKSHPG